MTFIIKKMKRIIYIFILFLFSFYLIECEDILEDIDLVNGNYSKNFTLNKEEIFKIKGEKEFNYIKIFVKVQEIESDSEIPYNIFYQTENCTNISRLYQSLNDTRKKFINIDDLQTDSNIIIKCDKYPCNIKLNFNGIKNIPLIEEENNTYYIIQQKKEIVFKLQNVSQQFKNKKLSEYSVEIFLDRNNQKDFIKFKLIGTDNNYNNDNNLHKIKYDEFKNKIYEMIIPEISAEEIDLSFLLTKGVERVKGEEGEEGEEGDFSETINYKIIFNNLASNVEIDNEPNKDDDDNNKTLILLICTIVIVLLVIIGVYAWFKKSKVKNKELNENINQISFQNEDRNGTSDSIIF